MKKLEAQRTTLSRSHSREVAKLGKTGVITVLLTEKHTIQVIPLALLYQEYHKPQVAQIEFTLKQKNRKKTNHAKVKPVAMK